MQRAQREWFERTSGEVYQTVTICVIHQLTTNPTLKSVVCDAADFVQEAMFIGYVRWNEFRGETSQELVAWITAIAVNCARDESRRCRRQRRDVRRTTSFTQKHLHEYSDRSPTPPEIAINNESRQRLLDDLGCLPSMEREAINARYLEGESVRGVANALDRSEAAVSGLLKRGLARLRTLSPRM